MDEWLRHRPGWQLLGLGGNLYLTMTRQTLMWRTTSGGLFGTLLSFAWYDRSKVSSAVGQTLGAVLGLHGT